MSVDTTILAGYERQVQTMIDKLMTMDGFEAEDHNALGEAVWALDNAKEWLGRARHSKSDYS